MARDLVLMTMERKYTSAQCCVSMVTYVAMQDALDALELEGGSSFKNIIAALNKLKTPCDQVPRAAGRPPLQVARAIVEVRSKQTPGLSHFVVWSAGAWYDPHVGFSEMPYHERWPKHFYANRFIEIKNVR